MAKKILVVCIGNICRSPMAAALLKEGLPENFEVSSAGIGALVGEPAHETSAELMNDLGLDIEDHVARQLDEQLLNSSDIVLTMEDKHTDWIENQWPHARGRVYRWGHWDEFDISDP
ncbi:MAG: low molecular weight phosphotyrosine protein phosphatase, partial [Gammaproteobacteria bacterium]|nr:low molecular weight phosphotyrosine protein phosphatase [Gammaproteobacteria bacterium]